jgi:hypothetical protein
VRCSCGKETSSNCSGTSVALSVREGIDSHATNAPVSTYADEQPHAPIVDSDVLMRARFQHHVSSMDGRGSRSYPVLFHPSPRA